MNNDFLKKIYINDINWIEKNINKISTKDKNYYLKYTYKNNNHIFFNIILSNIEVIEYNFLKEVIKKHLNYDFLDDDLLFKKLCEKKYSTKVIDKTINYYYSIIEKENLKNKEYLNKFIKYLYEYNLQINPIKIKKGLKI